MKTCFFLHIFLFSFVIIAREFFLPMTIHAQQPQGSEPNFQIHLVVNQQKYAPGETVFIKAYLLDRKRKGVQGKHMISVFLVDDRGNCHQTIRFNLLSGRGDNQFALPVNLNAGAYRVVAYVSPLEERTYGYIASKTIAIVNQNSIIIADESQTSTRYDSVTISSGPINLAMQKTSFQKKENITVVVTTRDSLRRPVAAEFSVKVLNNNLEVNGFADRLMPGTIVGENDTYYKVSSFASPVEVANLQALSLLSVFQKNGNVINAETGEVVPDNTQVLFYLQRSGWYHQTFTLGNGNVRLNLPQFTGSDELFYIAETERGKIIPVKVIWDTLEVPSFASFSPAHESGVKDPYATFMTKKTIIHKSYDAFAEDDNAVQGVDLQDDFDLVEPDQIYRTEKFVHFNSMAEMILEVIPGMFHRRNNKTEIVRLTLPNPMTATADPVYFIDGWATTNTELFLSVKPSDLEYIAVVKEPKKLQPLKLLGKNGIVIVKSKQRKNIHPGQGGDKLEGLNSKEEFENSVHQQKPEFRSTLYWNPSISTDRDGRASFQFSATDDVGEMMVEVEGFTVDGQPFIYRMPIHVR